MSNFLKKHEFSLATLRLFTRGERDAYDLIHLIEPELSGDESLPALECPDNWSPEAAAILADEALCPAIPARLKPIEENTAPSWLWRKSAFTLPVSARRADADKAVTKETSARQIFDRCVGAAVYTAWKQGLFADESAARNFFDEARYALMQRFITLEPAFLAHAGLDWAYGFEKPVAPRPAVPEHTDIPNAMIDAIVSGRTDKNIRAQWQKILSTKTKSPVSGYGTGAPVRLCFADIAADWGTTPSSSSAHIPIAMLDLMAFRHNNGAVNIDMLRHATRLLVILLDLHGQTMLEIGFVNLAPLLMALALPYDSDAARATAAAISAIIMAEAVAASAELAGLRGTGAAFAKNRDQTLRALRNYRRTAYGDHSDYEKLSVLPMPLSLDHSPDLALAAAAQRRWDEALALARQYGLRHTHLTSLAASPTLAVFMESASQGIEPLPTLTVTHVTRAGNFQREIHPSVIEALARLGYDKTASRGIIDHIAGTQKLITHTAGSVLRLEALRAKGFDAEALQRIEDYLPHINDLRLAFTPWILGRDFCRKVLKIPEAKLDNPRFDMLRHLGFSAAAIDAANAVCYGNDTAAGSKLNARHRAVFARGDDVSLDARIRMAAAVQGFISGSVDLRLSLPADTPAAIKERLLLSAWRQGVKGLHIIYDITIPLKEKSVATAPRKIRSALFLHTKKPALPVRKIRAKANATMISMKRRGSEARRPSGKS